MNTVPPQVAQSWFIRMYANDETEIEEFAQRTGWRPKLLETGLWIFEQNETNKPERVFAHDLMHDGGPWLAEAREYLLWKVPNGDNLIWSSSDKVNITVRQIEELACQVAAAAINEDRKTRK